MCNVWKERNLYLLLHKEPANKYILYIYEYKHQLLQLITQGRMNTYVFTIIVAAAFIYILYIYEYKPTHLAAAASVLA